jgi:hypothetical protein
MLSLIHTLQRNCRMVIFLETTHLLLSHSNLGGEGEWWALEKIPVLLRICLWKDMEKNAEHSTKKCFIMLTLKILGCNKNRCNIRHCLPLSGNAKKCILLWKISATLANTLRQSKFKLYWYCCIFISLLTYYHCSRHHIMGPVRVLSISFLASIDKR